MPQPANTPIAPANRSGTCPTTRAPPSTHSRKWRCCGSMIAASRGPMPKNPGSNMSTSVEHAVAAHVVGRRRATCAGHARRRSARSRSRSTRQSSPAGDALPERRRRRVRRGTGPPCRRWRCRSRPGPRLHRRVRLSRSSRHPSPSSLPPRRDSARRRIAPRSVPVGRGRRRPRSPLRRPVPSAAAEVGGERAHGREAEDVGERQRHRRRVGEPAEHLDGEQRVAADVEEVVVAADGRARARRPRCRRRAARRRRPAARSATSARRAPMPAVGRAAPCGRSCRSA